MKAIKYSVFFVIIAIILNGCSFGSKNGPDDSAWENEILMAQSCGMDGLMCCPDKEPACQFGQECCVDPNDAKRNYCSDKCDFGTEGSYCRTEGELCDQGLVCNEGNCVVCGGTGNPCCQKEEACLGELICHKDTCVECGIPGNPCCGEDMVCADALGSSRVECRKNICTFCGSTGGIYCETKPLCDAWHLQNNGFCLSCGNYNQPCCKDGENKFCRENGLVCKVGFCAKE